MADDEPDHALLIAHHCYGGGMETPEISLSTSERRMLASVANGASPLEMPPDWLALQRLRQFGLVEELSLGHKITAEGQRVLAKHG